MPPDARRSLADHIDACEACRRAISALDHTVDMAAGLGSAPTAVGSPTPRTRAITAEEPWPEGHEVGRYIVHGRLGRGGMGTVYRAEDTELARPVALKRLHATANAETRARLVREARAAAQLAHPNVVTVYEVGDDHGAPFIAMELVDGVTLTAWIAETPRPWRAVTAMLAQAGRGLAAAHARGLVHRDFKPDNVLIERSAAQGRGAIDSAGRARVADFGLARAGDEVRGLLPTSDVRLGRLTETGALAGTPAYLAPELVAGEPPDARSDQYAFAIALYEGLHGQHPFAGATAPALWAAMAAGEIRAGARPVPAWLDRHVRRGLAVDPAARFPDVASFVAAIEPPAKRHTAKLVAGGVAVAGAIVATLVLTRTAPPDRCAAAGAPIAKVWTERRAQIAAALGAGNPALASLDAFATRWQDAAGDACRAHDPSDLGEARAICLDRARIRVAAVVDDLATGGSAAIAGAPASADALPDLAACADKKKLKLGEALPANHEERDAIAAIERDLADADVLRDRGELAGAADHVKRAKAAAAKLEIPALEARASLTSYELDRDRGDSQAAALDATDATAGATATGQQDLMLTAKLALIGSLAGMTSKKEEVDEFPPVPEGMAPSRESGGLYLALGRALENGGRYPEAEAAFRHAQADLAKVLPADHVERLIADYEVAGALVMQRRDADALPMLEHVRAGLDGRVSPLRRESIDVMHAIGIAQGHLGHADAALAADREVLARRTQIFGEHSAMAAVSRDELAAALDATGDYAGAAASRELGIADVIAATNASSLNAAQARVNLAEDQTELGRYDAAIATLALARPILVQGKGEDHVEVAISDLALANAKLGRAKATHARDGLGDLDALLDRVAANFTASFGAHSAPMSAVDEARGRLAVVRGRWADADRAFAEAIAVLGDHGSAADRAELELVRADALAHTGHAADARASADAAAADYVAAGTAFASRAAEAKAWRASGGH